MNKYGMAFVLLVLSLVPFQQGNARETAVTLGGAGWDSIRKSLATADGGTFMVGATASMSAGEKDFWLLKLEGDGSIAWQRAYGGKGNDYAQSAAVTHDGGFIVTGVTYSHGAGESDGWVLKLDGDGGIEWQKAYGGEKRDHLNAIAATADGGYIAVGASYSFGAGDSDIWVLKLDAFGAVVWQKTYGGAGFDWGFSVMQDSGGYMVTGDTFSAGAGRNDALVMRLDAEGNVLWQKTYGGGRFDLLYAMRPVAGGYILGGTTSSFGAGGYDLWLVKLDSQGAVLWQKIYGGVEYEWASDIVATDDGGYVAVGGAYSFGAGEDDIWAVKTDGSGNVLWQKSYGGAKSEYGTAVSRRPAGGFAITGMTRTYSVGDYDLWVLLVDGAGEIPGLAGIGPTKAAVAESTAVVAAGALVSAPGAGVTTDTDAGPDADNDGVANDLDSFPTDPAASVDSDGDGYPDFWNPGYGQGQSTTGLKLDRYPRDASEWADDDADSMPDNWERLHGLDPLVDDGGEDADGDGISNYEEYSEGSDPRSPTPVVSGRITDSRGNPLAKIRVEAHSASLRKSASASSGPEGFYRIPVSPTADYRVVVWQTGGYQTLFHDNARQWKEASLVDTRIGSVAGIDFNLIDGAVLSGTITGLGAGHRAVIEAWSGAEASWASVMVIGSGAGSDDYQVKGIVPEADYLISAHAEGYLSGYRQGDNSIGAHQTAEAVKSGDSADIVLSSGSTLSGYLSGLHRGEKASVTAWSETKGVFAAAEIVSAGAGQDPYVIHGLPDAADYLIFIGAEGYLNGYYGAVPGDFPTFPVSIHKAARIEIRDGPRQGVNIAMTTGCTLGGTVRGLGPGETAVVSAWSESAGGFGFARVTGAGSEPYMIGGLFAANDYLVAIDSEGYERGLYGEDGIVGFENGFPVDAATNPRGINFTLSAGKTISGVISGMDRGERALVEAWSERTQRWSGTRVVGTDGDVSYALTCLPASADFEVRFNPEYHQRRTRKNIDSSANPGNIHFAAADGVTISGRITNAAPGETVFLYAASRDGGEGKSSSVQTTKEGTAEYVIKGLASHANYVVSAGQGAIFLFFDGEDSGSRATPVDLSAGDRLQVDFDFGIANRHGLTGAIAGLSENTRARISAWDVSSGAWADGSRLGDGEFALLVPEGSYHVGIHARGFVDGYYAGRGIAATALGDATALTISGPEDIGVMTLPPAYSLSGRVYLDRSNFGILDSGEELAGAYVEVVAKGLSRGDTSDARGRYAIRGLAGNETYDLRVWSLAGMYQDQISLGSEDVSDVDIGLGGDVAGSLTGTVYDGETAKEGAVVRLFSRDLFVNAQRTDRQGKFFFQGLSPGEYLLDVDINGDGVQDVSDIVTIAAGSTTPWP